MLIKVTHASQSVNPKKPAPARYINTDYITTLVFEQGRCFVHLSGHATESISEDAGNYIAEMMEANEGFTPLTAFSSTPALDPAVVQPAIPPPIVKTEKTYSAGLQSLKSRIAQTLRDTWKRLPTSALASIVDADPAALAIALEDLTQERVVLNMTDADGTVYYFHASHRAQYIPSTKAPCPVCKGARVVQIAQGSNDTAPCYFCEASGEIDNNDTPTASKADTTHTVTDIRYSAGELYCIICGRKVAPLLIEDGKPKSFIHNSTQ